MAGHLDRHSGGVDPRLCDETRSDGMHSKMNCQTVSFGEVVFDCFGDEARLGGAPLNVAWNLRQVGLPSTLVSAIGRDDLGTQVRGFLTAAGIPQTYVLDRLEHSGTAAVELDGENAAFVLSEGSAWEHIELPPELALNPDLVYFGSVARRTQVNQDSLRRLLDLNPLHRFYDANLRAPYYTKKIILDGLAMATIVKLSADEWEVVKRITGLSSPSELLAKFELDIVAVTRGADGAELCTPSETLKAKSHPVTCVNPVGAGDAFSAVLAAGILRNNDLPRTLEAACTAGAAVVQEDGAQICLPDEVMDLLS